MKKFLKHMKNRPPSTSKSAKDIPSVNLNVHIDAIKKHEAERGSELGRLINGFEYGDFTLRLDRDVMGMYRVAVYSGQDRWYSFSLRCPQGDYDALREAFQEIMDFLSGDRRLSGMPDHEKLKGHYFGPGGR